MMPRVGLYLFRTALLLLPSRFRARLGPSLQSVFESGQQEVHDAGNPFSLVLFWCREVWGMLRLAVGLRVRGRWSWRESLGSVTLLAVGLLLVSFAALASLAPSRRAATVDPLVALRAE